MPASLHQCDMRRAGCRGLLRSQELAIRGSGARRPIEKVLGTGKPPVARTAAPVRGLTQFVQDFGPLTLTAPKESLMSRKRSLSDSEPRLLRTAADVAWCFDVSRRTVFAWLAAGCPGKGPDGLYSAPAIAAWRRDH